MKRSTREPSRRTRTSGLASAAASCAAIVLLVVSWSLAIGRYGGPDEPAHVVRAAAVGDGELGGDTVPSMASGFRVVDTPGTLATGTPSCYRHDARVTAACADAIPSAGVVPVASAAGINPPLYYAAIGAPVRWWGDAGDTTWYRLVAAGWTSALVLLAVAASRPLARRQRLAFLLVVPPAAWFLGGVVNPSAWEIGACLLAWIGLARIDAARIDTARIDTAQIDTGAVGRARVRAADAAWFGVPAAVAIAVRPVAILWVATMAVVLLVRTWRAVRWSRAALTVAAGPVAAALVGVALWNRWIGLELTDAREASTDGLLDRIRVSLGGTRATLHEMVGSFGWAEFGAPGIVQVAWWLGVIGMVVLVWRSPHRRARVALAMWACGVVLGPVAFEAVTADDVGYIWQGRYSIAAFLGLAALVGPSSPSASTSTSSSSARAFHRLDPVVAAVAVLAAAELGTFWAVLRRYTVGSSGSWWLTAGSGSLEPAVPARWLLAIHTVVLFGATVRIGAAIAARAGHPSPVVPSQVM